MPPKRTVATVIPTVRYRDARAAIAWLERAFGFEPSLVVPGPNDTVAHAQLRFGNGMVMLGSAGDDEYGRLVGPATPGAPCTQGVYVIVDDVDAHHARAAAAGAEIVRPPVDEDYGGRGYTCRDPQGQVWSFGSYDPWAH